MRCLTRLYSIVVKNTNANSVRSLYLFPANRNLFKVQDDKDFIEKVENSKGPVIVDFYANWCGPCKALAPRLENVVAKKNGKLNVAKVDIDALGEVAAKYDVGTIPALVVFRNGKVEERLIGLQDEDKLSNWIDKVIDGK